MYKRQVQKEYGNNEIIKGKIETEITVYLNNNFTNGDLGSLEAIKNLVKEEYIISCKFIVIHH